MKKILNTLFVIVCVINMAAGVHAKESEAFKKYGQEFKGKIAKSLCLAKIQISDVV